VVQSWPPEAGGSEVILVSGADSCQESVGASVKKSLSASAEETRGSTSCFGGSETRGFLERALKHNRPRPEAGAVMPGVRALEPACSLSGFGPSLRQLASDMSRSFNHLSAAGILSPLMPFWVRAAVFILRGITSWLYIFHSW